MTTCTETEALAKLARSVAGAGGCQKCCDAHQVNIWALERALVRKRPLSDEMLNAIGLCRIDFKHNLTDIDGKEE